MVWVSAEFNLSGTFIFIDKKILHLMTLCPVQILVSLSMSCLPKRNCIYKFICQINKRSLLALQQEIAYYLKGTFKIQWEINAAFWREESSLLILLLMVIPQNYKLQHRARMKGTSFFLRFIYQCCTLHFEYPHKLLIIAQKFGFFFLIWRLTITLELFILTDVQEKKE